MAQAMIALAGTHTTEAYLHGLVRPANPASARVLERAGFTEAGTVSLNGAESRLWIYALGAAPQVVHFTGAWQPVVTRQNGALHYEAPIDSGTASYTLKIEIAQEDLDALRRSPDRAAIAHAVLHPHAQAGQRGAGDAAQAILRKVLHTPRANLGVWLTERDRLHRGAVSNHLSRRAEADIAALRRGSWLPLPHRPV
jgi:hypothetical protein